MVHLDRVNDEFFKLNYKVYLPPRIEPGTGAGRAPGIILVSIVASRLRLNSQIQIYTQYVELTILVCK